MRLLRVSRLLRPWRHRHFSATSTMSPIFEALARHDPQKKAITDPFDSHTYADLISRTQSLQKHLPSGPVAIYLSPDLSFVQSLLAVWQAGAIPVPLSPLYPPAALSPLLKTVSPSTIVSSSALKHRLPDTSCHVLNFDSICISDTPIHDYPALCNTLAKRSPDKAMVFFTSGTTGNPKGVVWTQQMLQYQLQTLSKAWHWSSDDHILNVLPLHHIHGLVNVVLSALFNGAHLQMHSSFNPEYVWKAFRSSHPPTVFMAVPAVYKKLIMYYNEAPDHEQANMKAAARDVRLFVCGSASLPRTDYDRWFEISGQKILERYGMTETGMTLSNPYHHREAGMLGTPLPGVETQIVDGELRVRGPGVFNEYWGMPEATKESFVDGWFRTGDVVEIDERTGYYRFLGRASADIVKTGGYKVSALEIEEVLRSCDGVEDCCVVGGYDEVLGERIIAVLVVDSDAVISGLRRTVEKLLPKYKLPREYRVVDEFPRNVLGKVQKQVLRLKLGI